MHVHDSITDFSPPFIMETLSCAKADNRFFQTGHRLEAAGIARRKSLDVSDAAPVPEHWYYLVYEEDETEPKIWTSLG
jgi:hypothetical protein